MEIETDWYWQGCRWTGSY